MKTFVLFKSSLIVSALFAFIPTAFAATYYADPVNGSDDPRMPNAGSKDAPFKTISRAASVVASGDTIKLKPGVFSYASGERFPLYVPSGVKITSAQSTYMENGSMRSVIGGGKPSGSQYASAFEVWGDLTVEKVEISGFDRPFNVESSGDLNLNIVAFFNNRNGAFQVINGGEVDIEDITIGGGTGGFYVGTGSDVDAVTVYVHDSATSGIEVSGVGASLHLRNLNFNGAPKLTLLKIRDYARATLVDANINGTGACASPCTELAAVKAYETSEFNMEGGLIKWNRPGYALYGEVDTVMSYVDSINVRADSSSSRTALIERKYKNDFSGKGLISFAGYFGLRTTQPGYGSSNMLEVRHPDGVGLELRNWSAEANLFQVRFKSKDGVSVKVRKGGELYGTRLNFTESGGTHVYVDELNNSTPYPVVNDSTFSQDATRVLQINSCSSSSYRSDFRYNTSWKKNVQGADSNGRYESGTRVTGYASGGNYRIEDNCVVDIGS